MLNRYYLQKLTLPLALTIGVTLSGTTYAESSNGKTDSQLYHVEISIFTNYTPESEDTEYWPTNIELHYSSPLFTLIQAQAEQSSTSDDALSSVSMGQNIEKTALKNQILLLPDSEKFLYPTIKKIRRTNNKRVLFHESWIQDINNLNSAINIAVHGGGQFDNHFELEGSIRLSRERYLHIETNLWLSSFAINVGQEGEPWPILPPQPYIPYDNEITSQPNIQLDDLLEFGSQFQNFLQNQYFVERIVTMKQHRKMRSKELHYLDHPQIGLLIMITPHETEIPEEENEQSNTPVEPEINPAGTVEAITSPAPSPSP